MIASQVQRLCELLALGRPVGPPAPVAGGLLHTMWRMETERGTYAVKQQRPALVGRAGEERYALTEEIAE